jgi:REP element-mobilizing transposase RayT
MSYISSHYHIIFRTYRSELSITEEYERELYMYMFGIAQSLQCKIYRIGGMPDHIHIFASLPGSISLSTFVQKIKANSSRWLRSNPHFPNFHGWEHEYAGISYNYKDKDMIIGYIKRQKEHHRKVPFAEEYRAFLVESSTN